MKQKTNRKPVVKADLFREVTDKMIAALESGTPPWRQAWQCGMGAAFLCADLGIRGDLQHESYIASWLTILREDKRAIFRAARYAREAFEYLTSETENCR
ncbi:TPA: DUF1738 domain-containing protein [Morganella morganii]|nr:DUF1738 domain-containing protein [Morganella morganii]HCR3198866.1 DUF1738 domain-containing protein [Morganella morganii]HCT8187365.1 DUF1738 domain-containing protein [Morganella morganii]